MEVQSSQRLARVKKCSFIINIIMIWYVSKFFYHQDINFHQWRYKVHKDWRASRNVLLFEHGIFLLKLEGTKFTKTGLCLEMCYYYHMICF